METFAKKCEQFNLEQRLKQMVANALVLIDPQPAAERQPEKPRTAIEFYIRRMLFVELHRRSVEDILKVFRRMPWRVVEAELIDPNGSPTKHAVESNAEGGEPEASTEEKPPTKITLDVSELILKYFCKIWKVKFNDVYLMADIAAGLGEYHPDFAVNLVDFVLEQIRFDMEDLIDFQYHQQRILMVKYLGELYNYSVVNSGVIFDTLYSLIFFGHPAGRASPNQPSAIDPPDDFFRVRLVCVLLETCGRYFERGALRKRTYYVHFDFTV